MNVCRNNAISQVPASPISCMMVTPISYMRFCQSGSLSSACPMPAWRWSARFTMGPWAACSFPPTGSLPRSPPEVALALATFIAAAGYLIMALPFGFPGLCIGLILAGVGSSVQHPRASLLVTNTYGKSSREPLGIYNFAGDLGKATFPAIVALLLPIVAWRPVVGLMALVGLVVAVTLLVLVPQQPLVASAQEESETKGRNGRGFSLLLAIGACDTATRMGYLLFLPFLLHAKGGNEATIGIGLALIFTGGALGKACCGWLGQRLGVVGSVIATEAATAILMVATLMVRLELALVVLPLLGNRSQRHVLGPLRDRPRTGAEGRDRPSLRAVLHWRHWSWRISANRIRRYCGPFQQNHRCRRSSSDSSCDHPNGSRPASLPAQEAEQVKVPACFVGLQLSTTAIKHPL